MADKEEEKEVGEEGSNETAPEEEAKVDFKPLVNLKEVEVVTHEEDEETLFKMRAKLFRFDKDSKQWKERGTGDVKFLQHKKSKKIRVLMRREKTLKVCANHYILPVFKLQENVGSDRSWVWTCPNDFADEEPKEEVFAIRFANTENAQKFKSKFEESQDLMRKLEESGADLSSETVEKELKKLSVSDGKETKETEETEEKEEKETA